MIIHGDNLLLWIVLIAVLVSILPIAAEYRKLIYYGVVVLFVVWVIRFLGMA